MKNLAKKILIKIITNLARAILWQHKPYIIAVTGNLGKTTTKDSIVAVLKDKSVRGSAKSFNSDIGVPLTIINSTSPHSHIGKWLLVMMRGVITFFARDYPEYLVLEVGADRPNDIRNIVKWLKPDMVILTQFAAVPVHIENFQNDRELLITEKEYLALAATEILIYNGDDIDCQRIAKRALLNRSYLQKVSFGRGLHNTLILRDAGNSYDLHSAIGTIEYDHRLYKMSIDDTLGTASIIAAMPAVLAALYIETSLDTTIDDDTKIIEKALIKLNKIERQPGRMRPLYGIKNTLIIDDTYNSSPKALENGLETLRDIGIKYRRIVVLGDMKELGTRAASEHYRLGRMVPSSASILITYGTLAHDFARGAIDAGMKEGYVLECETLEDVVYELHQILKAGDIIYVKGSQSMRMEKVVKEILDKSHNPTVELARQDREWQEISVSH